MALQTFTAGQVLTAAQMTALQTNDFNQTVSTKVANYTFVVGDRGTRVVGNGTSITFTVDNNIFTAGDTIKLHNINSTALTIAAGAGVTINAAAGLTMVQWQEATLFATSASSFILFESTAATTTQGLTLINTTSFSAVASQSFNNVFSATYTNYRIVFNVEHTVGLVVLNFRLRVSGTDATGANYNFQTLSGDNTISGGRSQNQTSSEIALISTSVGNNGSTDIYRPFLTNPTSFITQTISAYNSPYGRIYWSEHTPSTSYDGFTIFPPSGNMTGTVSVYGYNK